MEAEIQHLEEKWEDFIERKNKEKFSCEQCGRMIYGYEHNLHYWKEHFFWMFCRRTGIHWKMYQIKNLLK